MVKSSHTNSPRSAMLKTGGPSFFFLSGDDGGDMMCDVVVVCGDGQMSVRMVG